MFHLDSGSGFLHLHTGLCNPYHLSDDRVETSRLSERPRLVFPLHEHSSRVFQSASFLPVFFPLQKLIRKVIHTDYFISIKSFGLLFFPSLLPISISVFWCIFLLMFAQLKRKIAERIKRVWGV